MKEGAVIDSEKVEQKYLKRFNLFQDRNPCKYADNRTAGCSNQSFCGKIGEHAQTAR
jgi:hypothetical protein